MVALINKENVVCVHANEYASVLNIDKIAVEKSGIIVEIYNGHIKIIVSSGNVLRIDDGYEAYFKDNATGNAFASMDALFERLVDYTNDKTGTVI